MDSWNYGSEGKGFVLSDEMVSPTDALSRSRTVVMGWDLKTPCNYENTRLVSGRDVEENQGFMELGFPDITRKPLPDNLCGVFLNGKISTGIETSPTCFSNSKEFFREESCSGFSSSAGDSNSRDSSFIDLKLGRLDDYQDAQIGKSSREMPALLSVVSSVPEKRARTTSMNYLAPLCQVHGCNMDLSSSKDYHKRHKVCDVHSKTAKVIVNGIEQRFCQQCSRFHLLDQFDDGKRSCRKRLAGHNERRRKPQLDNHSGRTGKLHLPYNGTRFLGTSLPLKTSFISPNMFPCSIMQPMKYETSNWCRRVKLEDEEIYSRQSVMPIMNEHLLQKSSVGVEKQYPFLHGRGIDTTPRSSFCENNNRFPHNLPGTDSVSRFMLQSAPSGNKDITIYDAMSTIEGLSGASDSGSALSLLSSHSYNSSSHSSGISMGQPLLIQGSHGHYNLDHFSEKLFGLSSQAATRLMSNRFSSSGGIERLEPIVISDAINTVDFDVPTDGIFQGSDLVNTREYPLSHERTTTVDLLQLSSQLHRVEHQRHAMQVKHENDTFCCLPITRAV